MSSAIFAFLVPWILALPPLTEVPRGDGFIYPGDAGSEGIDEYERAWGAHLRLIPKLDPAQPAALTELAHLTGCWTVALRDYARRPGVPASIQTVDEGSAVVSLSSDRRWLRIEMNMRKRFAAYYIGYDAFHRGLTMHFIGNPVASTTGAIRAAPGWSKDRLVFGPVSREHAGLPLTDRITFVRNGSDQLRIVTEGRLASGAFVAVDDLLLTRLRPTTSACHP